MGEINQSKVVTRALPPCYLGYGWAREHERRFEHHHARFFFFFVFGRERERGYRAYKRLRRDRTLGCKEPPKESQENWVRLSSNRNTATPHQP